MTGKRKVYSKEFWNIYRNTKKAHPDYSQKRLMTVSTYACIGRYGTVEAPAQAQA